jgi:hypothetical protein
MDVLAERTFRARAGTTNVSMTSKRRLPTRRTILNEVGMGVEPAEGLPAGGRVTMTSGMKTGSAMTVPRRSRQRKRPKNFHGRVHISRA